MLMMNAAVAMIAALLLRASAPDVPDGEGNGDASPVPESRAAEDSPPVTLPDLPARPAVARAPSSPREPAPAAGRTRRQLIAAGATILGASWTAAVVWTALENFDCEEARGDRTCGDRSKLLFVPVAGPLLAVGHIANCSGWTCPAVWSAIQAGGAMIVFAALYHDGSRRRTHRSMATVSFLPAMSPKASAFGLSLRW